MTNDLKRLLARIVPSLARGVDLARVAEKVAPACGFHVALTGGSLYKDGQRKDVDLLFYETRRNSRDMDKPEADYGELFLALIGAGFRLVRDCGFVVKARHGSRGNYKGTAVDILLPDRFVEEGQNYNEEDPEEGEESLQQKRDRKLKSILAASLLRGR